MVEKIFLRIINGVDFPIKFYIHDELDDARFLKKTIEVREPARSVLCHVTYVISPEIWWTCYT